jgi:hypothetical protein
MTQEPSGTQSRGGWIQTYTGRQFWPGNPRTEDIELEDIAHALSNLCRFGGHCTNFYSVAQHSVLVADTVPVRHRKWALLHDASEAYLVDLPRPLKRYGALGVAYLDLEKRVMSVICDRFGLEQQMPAEVYAADNVVLATEKRDLMRACPESWVELSEPLTFNIHLLAPADAKKQFLYCARELGII